MNSDVIFEDFIWQWRKSRKLHKEFMNLPEHERKLEESKLYLNPVRNAYVNPISNWFVVPIIIIMILVFILLGIQMMDK